jgi:bifunctional DNase/RNase
VSKSSSSFFSQRNWLKSKARCSAGGADDAGNGEAYIPFPFKKDEYIEVAMQLIHSHRSGDEVPQATIILYSRSGNFLELLQQKEDEQILPKIKDEKCLVVEIGGDTISNISAALESTAFSRPLALDLLWQVLQRGQQISKNDWALVRVAIVDLRGGTFIGRLFFGDREIDRIYWDCDSRPSDGIWLALQSKCPVYVSKSVWDIAAVPLSKLVVMSNENELDEDEEGVRFYTGEGGKMDEDSLKLPLLGLKDEDPEPIKRLKRELQVALAEEDYGAAIRIRDHPFMVLYTEIESRRKEGKEAEAEILRDELNKAIQEHEAEE